MNAQRSKALFVGAIFIVLFVIGLGYYRMGGLNPVKVELVEVDSYNLLGRYFEGSYKSDTVAIYFNEMQDYIESGRITGDPVIIYYQEPEGVLGLSRIFVGIRLSELGNTEKQEFGHLLNDGIQASSAIRVSKEAHISVMPNPEKIAKLIESFAEEHNLKIGTASIEIYQSQNRLVVERPVVKSE